MEENKDVVKNESCPVIARVSFTLGEQEALSAIKTACLRRGLGIRVAQTAALAVILAMYLQAVVIEPGYTLGFVMAAVCIAVLAAVWIAPLLQARRMAERALRERYSYSLAFYDIAMVVEESERSASRVPYDQSRLLDTPEFFILLGAGGRSLYCIPKRAVSKDELQPLSNHLHQRCEKATVVR